MNQTTPTTAQAQAAQTTIVQPPANVPEFEQLLARSHRPVGIFENPDQFKHAQRVAGMLVTSSMVPEHFRGQENLGNAVIAVDMAFRLKLNPLMVMQNLFVIHGKPGMAAQLVIAIVNGSKQFSPLQYRMAGEGDKRSCVTFAKHLETGEVLEGPAVDMALAKREGWTGKNGSKWLTIPDLMLRYRAASWWSRLFAPELTMGLQTIEELQDVEPEPQMSRPLFTSPTISGSKEAVEPSSPVKPEPSGGDNMPPQQEKPPISQPSSKSTVKTDPKPAKQENASVSGIRLLMKPKNITEAELLAFLIATGSADNGTDTLEELALANDSIIGILTSSWPSIESRLIEAREGQAQ